MSVRIEFISEGFKEILCSDGVKNLVDEEGKKAAGRAGAGYSNKTVMGGFGGGRWISHVVADNDKAVRDESENKTLSKAVN